VPHRATAELDQVEASGNLVDFASLT
jgi:hypothetical protein